MSDGVNEHGGNYYNSKKVTTLSKSPVASHKLPVNNVRSALSTKVDQSHNGCRDFNKEDVTSVDYFLGENPLQIDLDALPDQDEHDPTITPHHPFYHRKIAVKRPMDSDSLVSGSPQSESAKSQSSDDIFHFDQNSNHNSPVRSDSPLYAPFPSQTKPHKDKGSPAEVSSVIDLCSPVDPKEKSSNEDESMLLMASAEDGCVISISDLISLASQCALPGESIVVACEVEVEDINNSSSPPAPRSRNPSQADSGYDLANRERDNLTNDASSSSQSDGFSGVISEGSLEDELLGLTVQDEKVLVNNAAELLTQLVTTNDIDIEKVQRCITESRDQDSAQQSFDDLMSYHLAGKAVEECINKMRSNDSWVQVQHDNEEVDIERGKDIKTSSKQAAMLGNNNHLKSACIDNEHSKTPEKISPRHWSDIAENESSGACQMSVNNITLGKRAINESGKRSTVTADHEDQGNEPFDKATGLIKRSKSHSNSKESECCDMSSEPNNTTSSKGSGCVSGEVSKSRKNSDLQSKTFSSDGRSIVRYSDSGENENVVNDYFKENVNTKQCESPNVSNEEQIFDESDAAKNCTRKPNNMTCDENKHSNKHIPVNEDNREQQSEVVIVDADSDQSTEIGDEANASEEDDKFSVAYTNAADDFSPSQSISDSTEDSDCKSQVSGKEDEKNADSDVSLAVNRGDGEFNGDHQNHSTSIDHKMLAEDYSSDQVPPNASAGSLLFFGYDICGSKENYCDRRHIFPYLSDKKECIENETKSPTSTSEDDDVIIIDVTPPTDSVEKQSCKTPNVQSDQRKTSSSESSEYNLSHTRQAQSKGDINELNHKACKVVIHKLDLNKKVYESGSLNRIPRPKTSQNESGQYECFICSRAFPTLSARRIHHMAHSNQIKFKCRYCSRSYSKKALLAHVRYHLSQRRFNCSYCGQAFGYAYQVRNHIKAVHLENPEAAIEHPYKCEECHRSFPTTRGLGMHKLRGYKVHLKRNSFDHIDKVTGIDGHDEGIALGNTKQGPHSCTDPQQKSFTCQECNKTFRLKSHLTLHMKRHVKKRTYKVRYESQNDQKITSNINLRSQINFRESPARSSRGHQIHDNHSDFGLRGESQQSSLGQTQEEMLFTCWICNAAFKKQVALNTHVVQFHLVRGGACDLCGLKWHKVAEILAHENAHTTEEKMKNPFTVRRKLSKMEKKLDDCHEKNGLKQMSKKKRSESNGKVIHVTRTSSSEESNNSADLDETNESARQSSMEQDDNQEEMEFREENNTDNAFFDTTNTSSLSDNDSQAGTPLEDNPGTSNATENMPKTSQKVTHNLMEEFIGPNIMVESVGYARQGNTESKQRAQREEPRKGHRCKKCNAVFQHCTSLIAHMRMHLIEKRHKCPVCGEMFRKKATLTNHVESHVPKKIFGCPVCGKLFKSRIQLLKHKLIHTGKASRKSLAKHAFGELHSPRKENVSRSSNKVLNRNEKTDTNAAVNQHCQTGEKLYKCGECNKAFKTAAKMLKHRKCHIEGNFICKPCGESFCKIGDLDEHFNTEHVTKSVEVGEDSNNELKCSVCNTPFFELQSLIVHMTTHLDPASLK